MAKNPGISTTRSMANPGWISAWRARPTGINGDPSRRHDDGEDAPRHADHRRLQA